jgi:hypothetical protein
MRREHRGNVDQNPLREHDADIGVSRSVPDFVTPKFGAIIHPGGLSRHRGFETDLLCQLCTHTHTERERERGGKERERACA